MKTPRPLTREQMRDIYWKAVEQYSMPHAVLLENAGREVARCATKMLGEAVDKRVVIAYGDGTFSAIGFVAARHLSNGGAAVLLLGATQAPRLEKGVEFNVEILNRLRVPTLVCCEERQIEAAGWVLDKAHLIIDILLGMEFQGQLRPPVQRLIERINQAHAGGPKVMAVDIPSGLGYDTGTTAGAVIQADLTATLVAPKIGMLVETARPYIGKVTLIDMGFPHELLPREE